MTSPRRPRASDPDNPDAPKKAAKKAPAKRAHRKAVAAASGGTAGKDAVTAKVPDPTTPDPTTPDPTTPDPTKPAKKAPAKRAPRAKAADGVPADEAKRELPAGAAWPPKKATNPVSFSHSALTASGASRPQDETSTPRSSRGRAPGRATAMERYAAEARVEADAKVARFEADAKAMANERVEAAEAAIRQQITDAHEPGHILTPAENAAMLKAIDQARDTAAAEAKAEIDRERTTMFARIKVEERNARSEAMARVEAEERDLRADLKLRLAEEERKLADLQQQTLDRTELARQEAQSTAADIRAEIRARIEEEEREEARSRAFQEAEANRRKEARQQAREQELARQEAREATERAERDAAEARAQAEREAAEARARAEREADEAKVRAEQQAAAQAERDRLAEIARVKAEQEAKERAQREAREAKERAAREAEDRAQEALRVEARLRQEAALKEAELIAAAEADLAAMVEKQAVGRAGVGGSLANAPTAEYALASDGKSTISSDRVPKGPKQPWSFGRVVRVFAGVDEKLLAHVPQEKPRYTGLGGIVIGTATIAAFSMWFAITEALGVASLWVIVPVLVWFLFILNFDRWLVSTAMVGSLRKTLPTLIMRCAMAIFFGVIIAEPLVLRIFQTAIEQHIKDERAQELGDLRSRLMTCNPLTEDASAPTPAGCDGYLLTFSSTPAAALDELNGLRTQVNQLQASITADSKQLAGLNEKARLECNGTPGPGNTGQVGEGPNCKRLRDDADAFAASHPLKPRQNQLNSAQARIGVLQKQVTDNKANVEAERTTQVNTRVADAQSHQGNIGILERMAGLKELAAQGGSLGIATWAVRLFFILIDCMPVLVKFAGGQTSYDRLVQRQLKLHEKRFDQQAEAVAEQLKAEIERRRAELQVQLREHSADLEVRVSRAVSRLESEYGGDPVPRQPQGRVHGGIRN